MSFKDAFFRKESALVGSHIQIVYIGVPLYRNWHDAF